MLRSFVVTIEEPHLMSCWLGSNMRIAALTPLCGAPWHFQSMRSECERECRVRCGGVGARAAAFARAALVLPTRAGRWVWCESAKQVLPLSYWRGAAGTRVLGDAVAVEGAT
jgi:hypothetical protein